MNGVTCERCGGKSVLFLCRECQTELHDMLTGLPRWLAHLAEAAAGQTRLGEAQPRTRGDEQPLRINLKASDKLALICGVLNDWVAKTQPVACDPFPPPRCAQPQIAAVWLSLHIPALAKLEESVELCDVLHDFIEDVERIINRPIPPRLCGPCPTMLGRHACGTQLYAPRDKLEVTCPVCRQTHNIEQLTSRLINETDYLRFTIRELVDVILPKLGERVPQSTLYDWHAKGKLKPAGYRRPNGAIGLTRHNDNDQPVFRLSSVRKLRSTQPGRAAS